MEKEGCVLGGEPSGHVIFRQNATTGDGALAGLKMIECVRFYKKTVSELTAGIKLYPNVLENVRVSEKPDLKKNKNIQATLKEVEGELGTKGRVVLRYSGTEPKCRVMVEGEDSALVNKSCQTLVEVVKAELG